MTPRARWQRGSRRWPAAAGTGGPSGGRFAAIDAVGIAICAVAAIAARGDIAAADEPQLAKAEALVQRLFEPGLDPAAAARDAAEAERLLREQLRPSVEASVAAAGVIGRLAAWHVLNGEPVTAERLSQAANLALVARASNPGKVRVGDFWVSDGSAAAALAENLHAMALLAEANGRPDDAERLFGDSLAATDAPQRECLRDLGRLLVRRRRFADAEKYLEIGAGLAGMDTLVIEDEQGRRRTLLDALPVVASQMDRAVLEAARANQAAALEAMDRSRRGLRLWLNQELRVRPARHQLSLLALDDALGLDTCLSLSLDAASDAAGVCLSAAWLANGKAAGAEAVADMLRGTQQAVEESRPGARETLDRLRRLQRQLAREVLLGPRAGAGKEAAKAEARRRIAELEREEQDLFARLGSAANIDRENDANWVELEAIRASIPPDAVLFDLARFDVRNVASRRPQDDWWPARYAVWIIPPAGDGDVRLVDLGPAAVIDEAVTEWRGILHAALGPRGSIATEGEAVAEARLARTGRDLARLVLDPLLAAVGRRVNELIVIPDGPLWLVSWAALPLEDGRYAIESFRLRHLAAARDLVPRERAGVKVQHLHRPLILAAPDFDLGLGAATADAAGYDRGAGGGRLLPRVAPLPGTEREAELIAPLVAAAQSGSADVATEEDATERRFLATARPEALVLATHGFFLTGPRVATDGLAASLLRSAGLPADAAFDTDPLLANPLARCGILLAGANAATPAGDGGDDGILTGLEIAGTDLRGTKLVVLSACDTAVGAVTDGEGVAGLRQAFLLAGARTVVATLWPIPDAETVELMTGFFESLAAGAPPARSLQQAQVATIAARRELLEAAHPAFWAAFTVTGGATR